MSVYCGGRPPTRLQDIVASVFFFQAEDGIRDFGVTGVQTCALPIFPWNEQILVGTTEIEDSGDPGDAQPAGEEVDYLLTGFLRFFPQSGITRADVRYAFSGVDRKSVV